MLSVVTAIAALAIASQVLGTFSLRSLYAGMPTAGDLCEAYEFRLRTYVPGAIVVVASAGVAALRRSQRFAMTAALLTAGWTMVHPEVQAWWDLNITGSRTVGAGYAVLKMGLPISAPLNAMLAWSLATIAKRVVWVPPVRFRAVADE